MLGGFHLNKTYIVDIGNIVGLPSSRKNIVWYDRDAMRQFYHLVIYTNSLLWKITNSTCKLSINGPCSIAMLNVGP